MFTRITVAAALLACLCAPASGQALTEATVPRIDVADLKAAMDAGSVLVLDVRDAASYAAGHLMGAVNVPPDQLQAKLPVLKAAKKPIVTYCA